MPIANGNAGFCQLYEIGCLDLASFSIAGLIAHRPRHRQTSDELLAGHPQQGNQSTSRTEPLYAGPGGASGNAPPGMVALCAGALLSRAPNTISVSQFTSKAVYARWLPSSVRPWSAPWMTR